MSHPVIPPIFEIAIPLATALELEVVDVVFQTNKRPPVLRVDIRNAKQDTSLDDCAIFSRALEAELDGTTLLPDAYVLEVSSPGIARQLSSDRDFLAFKGFGVIVTATELFAGHRQWRGSLQGRDEEQVYINLKGRAIALPRKIIATVQLDSQR